MASKIQSYKVICAGGLNTNQNYLELSEQFPGSAVELINFESSSFGGYKRIKGFQDLSPSKSAVTSATFPAEGPVLGVFGYMTSAGSLEYIAARKRVGLNEYKFYKLGAGGWTAIDTTFTHNAAGVSIVRAEVFNFSGKNIMIFVDGVNNAIAYNGTKWYKLNNTGAGTEVSPGGDQMINAPSIIANFKNHVFLAGDVNYPGIVCNSAPNDFLDWTAASGGGQQVTNFNIVQMKPFRDELYIFGRSSIKKCFVNNTNFLLQDVTTNLGCISRDSVVEVAGNIVFLSNDGIRIVAGTAKIGDVDLSTISDPIATTILEDVQNGNYSLDALRTVVLRKKGQFRYFLSNPTVATTEAYGLIGCLKTRYGEVGWEFGELKGIRASCTWSGYDNTPKEIVLHGDYDGHVYQQESGNSFNGAPIYAQYTTPYLDLGDTTIRKTMRKIHTFIKSDGAFHIDLGVKYDWDSIYNINPADYSESSSNNPVKYNAGFLYNDGNTYIGSSQPIFHTNIQGSGFSTQITFVSEGVYAPFTIQGFVLDFTVNGRQ